MLELQQETEAGAELYGTWTGVDLRQGLRLVTVQGSEYVDMDFLGVILTNDQLCYPKQMF